MKIDDGSGCFLDSRNDCYGCSLDRQWVGSDSGDHTCAPPKFDWSNVLLWAGGMCMGVWLVVAMVSR